ncbi:hypothetical protein KSP40_PGU014399 [Platanthera guangdongensis]|uniref:Uncharacterized protein n=1 Tax=Platanthera guangdongensis TaxID=2320717 RepID=A0ABR2MM60_9ASPA
MDDSPSSPPELPSSSTSYQQLLQEILDQPTFTPSLSIPLSSISTIPSPQPSLPQYTSSPLQAPVAPTPSSTSAPVTTEQVDIPALADKIYELIAPRLSLLLETSLAPLLESVAALSARLSSLFPQATPSSVCLDPPLSESRQGEMPYEVSLPVVSSVTTDHSNNVGLVRVQRPQLLSPQGIAQSKQHIPIRKMFFTKLRLMLETARRKRGEGRARWPLNATHPILKTWASHPSQQSSLGALATLAAVESGKHYLSCSGPGHSSLEPKTSLSRSPKFTIFWYSLEFTICWCSVQLTICESQIFIGDAIYSTVPFPFVCHPPPFAPPMLRHLRLPRNSEKALFVSAVAGGTSGCKPHFRTGGRRRPLETELFPGFSSVRHVQMEQTPPTPTKWPTILLVEPAGANLTFELEGGGGRSKQSFSLAFPLSGTCKWSKRHRRPFVYALSDDVCSKRRR